MIAQAKMLLTDAPRASRMGRAALDFARRHQGATSRVTELIKF
jgi:hypothetical protein